MPKLLLSYFHYVIMDLLTDAESAGIAALLPEELILEAGGQLQALGRRNNFF